MTSTEYISTAFPGGLILQAIWNYPFGIRVNMSLREVDYEEVLCKTPGAVKLRTAYGDVWVPSSLIEGDVPDVGEMDGTIEIPEWLAIKEGLE